MSHGVREHHGEVIARIREIATALNRPVAIMLDLSGPKIRTGKLRDIEVLLEDGAEVRITTDQIEGDPHRFAANYPLLPKEVVPGGRIMISDGEIELVVLETTDTEVVARVVHGGVLGEHKGINLPGARISLPSVTDKDIEDLNFGVSHNVDLVAQSFVRSSEDCRRCRELIREFGSNARLIAKIEKPEAIDDLENILEVADGVMVARGDLAVETSPELVPVLQKKIIHQALIAQKTIITATQMLQSMIQNPRPTRAEASDVSNAILDGSDAVMLSGETAVGRFVVESVAMMDRIIRSTEEMDLPARNLSRTVAIGSGSGSYGRAIAEAAMLAAEEARCKLIVVITRSGHMARRIAALRPKHRIIALTPKEAPYRQLSVAWGVEPWLLEDNNASESLLAAADRALVKYRLAEPGQRVVVMAGRLDDIIISLSIKIHRIGDLVGQ
jgi:pyruvate kinase